MGWTVEVLLQFVVGELLRFVIENKKFFIDQSLEGLLGTKAVNLCVPNQKSQEFGYLLL